jgi:predicted acylesterase/phospholipase RssA
MSGNAASSFHTLVLSGGANMALALIGGIMFLEHANLRSGIRRVVGSSAGGMLALLFALGLPAVEMQAWIRKLIEEFQIQRISLDGALDVCDTFGIDAGASLTSAMEKTLDRYAGSRRTFKEVAQVAGVDVVICTCNLETRSFEYLSLDTTPELALPLAICMTTAVPFLFAPVRYGNGLYVDPLMGRNFPFDFPGSTSSACTTKGVLGMRVYVGVDLNRPLSRHFVDEQQEGVESTRITSFPRFLGALMSMTMRESNSRSYEKSAEEFTMVHVNVSSLEPRFLVDQMEFEWSPDLMARLIHEGYTQTRSQLEPAILPTLQRVHQDSTPHAGPQLDQLVHDKDQEDARGHVHEELQEADLVANVGGQDGHGFS